MQETQMALLSPILALFSVFTVPHNQEPAGGPDFVLPLIPREYLS